MKKVMYLYHAIQILLLTIFRVLLIIRTASKLIDVNKDEWIITENHHEPIISKDKFEEVQNILDKQKCSRNSEDILLSYLKCADCGSLLYLKNGKNKKYYYCKNYIKHSKCTSHSVEREKLYDEVLQIINENKGLNITDKELNDSLLYRRR